MTIKELISLLEALPNKEVPVMVWDWELNDHIEISSVSLYESDKPSDSDNILGINIRDEK